MAHYIIDNHGHGFIFYQCSNCGAFFDEMNRKPRTHSCIVCKAKINPDENVYKTVDEKEHRLMKKD